MIIIKKDVLKNYLKLIGRNQSWLANRMSYTKGYISQIMHDDCQVSKSFVEKILLITNFQFEDIFYFDGKVDTREFYGEITVFEGEALNKRDYHSKVRERQFELADANLSANK